MKIILRYLSAALMLMIVVATVEAVKPQTSKTKTGKGTAHTSKVIGKPAPKKKTRKYDHPVEVDSVAWWDVDSVCVDSVAWW